MVGSSKKTTGEDTCGGKNSKSSLVNRSVYLYICIICIIVRYHITSKYRRLVGRSIGQLVASILISSQSVSRQRKPVCTFVHLYHSTIPYHFEVVS